MREIWVGWLLGHGSHLVADAAFARGYLAKAAKALSRPFRKAVEEAEGESGEEGARCERPPPGWLCTRSPPHDGPCAAVPCGDFQAGRESAAAIMEEWADAQERMAVLKEVNDCPGSAEYHMLEACVARRMANLSRKLSKGGFDRDRSLASSVSGFVDVLNATGPESDELRRYRSVGAGDEELQSSYESVLKARKELKNGG